MIPPVEEGSLVIMLLLVGLICAAIGAWCGYQAGMLAGFRKARGIVQEKYREAVERWKKETWPWRQDRN